MPTYRYKCNNCDGIYEIWQSIHDDPLDSCSCGDTPHRVVFASPVQFNGTGFYSTGE